MNICVGDIFLKYKILIIVLLLLCVSGIKAQQGWLSPSDIVVVRDGSTAVLACEEAGCIRFFNLGDEETIAEVEVDAVREIALSGDEKLIYAAAGGFNGRIDEIDVASGEVRRSFDAGHTPMSPLLSADAETLFFCNRFARVGAKNVFALDIATWRIKGGASAIREPCAMRLSRDDKHLWVVNFLPLMEGNREHVFSSVNVLTATDMKQVARLDLPPGSFAARDAAFSRDGRYFYVTHTIGRFTVPTTHLDRGWINTSAVSIFNARQLCYVNTVLLDDTMQGAANPWGIEVTDDDRYLCVNISGTHETIFVDVAEMFKRLSESADSDEVMNDLGFLYGAKTRVKLEGQGARAIAVHDSFIYVPMFYSDSVNMIEIWDDGPGAAVLLSLHESPQPDMVRIGDMAFNDATMCYQNWQSCASCHPDTRSDGTNWDLLNDGIGNPKQSRSLLYTHKTSPVMIRGVRAAAEIAVSKGFSHIQFYQVSPSVEESVNVFLKSLEPVPSPYLARDGTLTAAAKRGEKIFKGKAGCVKCHTPPYYSDKKLYRFGLGSDGDRDCEFATPILIEVWRTAPYMYDGRALSIKDVVTVDNKFNTHGNTAELKEQEVDDLVEYVNSL